MKKLNIFFIFLTVFQFSGFTQYSVQVGISSGGMEALPTTNEYEYSWSESLYNQNEIQSHGTITDIFYHSSTTGVGQNSYLFNQRIFMKLVTDNELISTTFPDTNQMTLVFSGSLDFDETVLTQIHLDVTFDYTPGYNLLILFVNKNGYTAGSGAYILFPCDHSAATNRTVYRYMNSSFQGGSGTFSSSLPVVYFKYLSGLDAGISTINQTDTFILPQQTDLTCKIHNYMADTITSADVEWSLDGTSQITVNWAGNSYCGQETPPIVLQNNFAFAPGQYTVKANTANPNAGTDELNTNDTLIQTIRASDNKRLAYWNYSDNTVPFLSNRSYGWSVSIYNKDSIDFSGQIHAIAYYVTNINGMVEPHQKIFMRTTTDLTNTSMNYPDTNQFTKVFDGEIDYSSTGWHIIKLDTVFDYNGSENLMILYENHAGIATVQATNFKTGWLNTDAVYNYDLNSFPTGTGSVATANRVPALRLYFSIPKDAGVTNLANSDVPVFTGNNDFIVDFKNFGLDALQNIDIKYSIDQNTPNSFHWNGNVNPQNEISNLNIGTENLIYGTHAVKIWTENPNYLPDYANANDTLKISLKACSPMSGTYTVGTAPSDFLTVKAAIDSLNNCGINGAVTFNIKSGTYNAQYILNEVFGSSATNTITFQSQTGDSTDVVLTTDSTDFLFKLYNANYITFNHLTFTGDSLEYLVYIDSTASDINFTGDVFTSDTSVSTFIYSPQANTQANITITNNSFVNGYNGIDLNHDNILINTNLYIAGNTFINQNSDAIRLFKINNADVTNNIFNTAKTGIYVNECDNITIEKNKLTLTSTGANGIFNDNSLTVTIANNFVSGIAGSGFNMGAIVVYVNSVNTNVYYNSVYLEAGNPFCGYTADSIRLYNNILCNRNGEAIYLGWVDYYDGNNNCFYTNNTAFASYNGNGNVNSLNDWIAQTQNDSNSVYGLPYFTSNSDLHTFSSIVSNLGTPIPYVTTDIDGESRDTNTPDIGADEFVSPCTGFLAGIYTIGATGDYPTFSNAVLSLYNCGIDSNVIFNVESGTYNEQIEILGRFILYDSLNYPITFQSQTGNSTDVILQYNSDTLKNYVVKIDAAQNIYFKDMTIQAIDTTYGRVIALEDSVFVNFENNRIIGIESSNENGQTACIYYTGNPNDTLGITLSNNLIQNGSSGFLMDDCDEVKSNININQNVFDNQNYAGINIDFSTHADENAINIITNTIQNSRDMDYGIYLGYINDPCEIAFNKINITTSVPFTGINSYANPSTIYNNFIAVNTVSNNPVSILGYWSTWPSNLYFNTIHLYGNESSFSSCIHINDNSGPDSLYNNCLINFNSERIIYNESGYSNMYMDNNNLYSTSSYFDYNYTINTIGGNTHSVSFMPNFVSETDLHTNDALLYQKGISVSGITTDIDGETRNNPPCIGADEFTNPVFEIENDTVFCYNDEYIQYSGSHTYDIGYGYDSYQWSNGSDSSSIVIDTNYSVVGNNVYTVTVTTGGNSYSGTVNILYDLPDAITQTDYCYWNSPVTITANPGFVSYYWSTGDSTQTITMNYGYSPYLTVTDSFGCQAQTTVHVVNATDYYPYDNYPADFNLPDTAICNNQSLLLNANLYSGTDVYSYFSFQWNTGDTTQTLTVDSNAFAPGNYSLISTVFIEANQLCLSTDTINITITDCSGINTMDNFDFIVYPNPAHNRIIVDGEKPDGYKLLSLTGKIFQKGIIFAMPKTIDISDLSQGIYLLKLQFGNYSVIKKVVIN